MLAPMELVIESDWSSASYFYSIVALSDIGSEIKLGSYKKDSLQGDSVLSEIYKDFGVETIFLSNEIVLKKVREPEHRNVRMRFSERPGYSPDHCRYLSRIEDWL